MKQINEIYVDFNLNGISIRVSCLFSNLDQETFDRIKPQMKLNCDSLTSFRYYGVSAALKQEIVEKKEERETL